MSVIYDSRMQARQEYNLALVEARRKHKELCKELGLFGDDVEKTFQWWLEGWDFEVEDDHRGGFCLCMKRIV